MKNWLVYVVTGVCTVYVVVYNLQKTTLRKKNRSNATRKYENCGYKVLWYEISKLVLWYLFNIFYQNLPCVRQVATFTSIGCISIWLNTS